MPSLPSDPPGRIVVDWGTSRMRAFLIAPEEETIVARREGPGIGSLNAPPEAVLRTVIQPWLRTDESARVVMCGMAGSRNGVIEVPYATTPADASSWLRSARTHHASELDLLIGAGLRGINFFDAPDMMRGEETQIFGAMRRHPSLATGRHVFVLPGTHSKWVEVSNGAITRLHTVLTGELYALLRDHSMLVKAGTADGNDDDGFASGLARSESAGVAIQAAIFETRSAQILLRRPRNWALEFLSGLLIGSEVAQMKQAVSLAASVVLVGDAELRARYRQAFAAYDVRTHELDGDACVIQGLRALDASVL
jgi:2-dehydro-3-deoxygalactonokinase